MSRALIVLPLLLVFAGCSIGGSDSGDSAAGGRPPSGSGYQFPPAPEVVDGGVGRQVSDDVGSLVRSFVGGSVDQQALDEVAASGDPRLAWLVSDLLRFVQPGAEASRLVAAFERLTGVDPRADPSFRESSWRSVTNHLIAWDLPAPPQYRERKAELFTAVEPGWKPFFADRDSDVDWRLVSWGGVFIDDRPAGATEPCSRGCIPALDAPALTDAAGGDWYPDRGIVFGVVVRGRTVAFPKNVMEVHEMVNTTIAGRRLGIPYCTLCGSAQAYFTDSVPGRFAPPVLRTSGLLSRSNKVMYDLRTRSVLDTFTGRALSGPLRDANVELDQTSVVAGTWGEWKSAHPETSIVARDGGIGREYPPDPLGGRDDRGPIFPTGPVDPRLPVQAQVVGVITPNGTAIAFPADQARARLAAGKRVAIGDIELVADGGGLRAKEQGGAELAAHQAYWFAWSQFHPQTKVWIPR